MASAGEHSYAAGYAGARGVRTWQERMKILEELGFIKSKQSGNQQYKYVLLVHPTIAVQRLYDAGRVPKIWLETYRPRQIEATEAPYEKLMERHRPTKAAPQKLSKAKVPRKAVGSAV